MYNKILNLIAFAFMTICLILSLILIVKIAFLRQSDLTVISDKIVAKKISSEWHGIKSGRVYFIDLVLANRDETFQLNMDSEGQAEKIFNLLDTSRIYNYHVLPKGYSNSNIRGIDQVDYNGIIIYKYSRVLILVIAIFISLISSLFIIYKIKKMRKIKNNAS